MLAVWLLLSVLLMVLARPALAETDGDMMDPAAWEGIRGTPLEKEVLEYRQRELAAKMPKLSALPERGFMLQKGDRLICLGDSITAAKDGYVDIVRNMITAAYPDRKIEVLNAGVSGNKVTEMLERVDSDVLARKPAWVTVSVGINDVWHGEKGVPLQEFFTKLDQLVGKLTTAGVRVILFTTTVIGEDLSNESNVTLKKYKVVIQEVAKKYKASVVPMNAAFAAAIERGRKADPEFKLTTDGVHPNPVGHTLMALTLLKTLRFGEPEKP